MQIALLRSDLLNVFRGKGDPVVDYLDLVPRFGMLKVDVERERHQKQAKQAKAHQAFHGLLNRARAALERKGKTPQPRRRKR